MNKWNWNYHVIRMGATVGAVIGCLLFSNQEGLLAGAIIGLILGMYVRKP